MDFPVSINAFATFLCEAKRATYAAQDEATRVVPVLKGSHQLEFRQGALCYQDIYYGGDFFVGQETVYFSRDPIWAMSYAGGVIEGFDPAGAPGIYEFLRAALQAVQPSAPFRGPEKFTSGKYNYSNRILGTISRFSGVEYILFDENPIYQLHYSGGMLKE